MNKFKTFLLGIYDVYLREFKLVVHDLGIIIFFAFLPLAYPVIYSLIYNPELVKEVPFVVVDHDRTSGSRELVRTLDACDEAWLLGYASDLNEARKAMDSHDVYAILEIPEGFSRDVENGEVGKTVLFTDMSLLLRYRGFLVATTGVMQALGAEVQTRAIDRVAPLAETIAVDNIMPINNVSLGDPQSGFASFIMIGVLILILQQSLLLAMGMAGGARHEKASVVGYNPHNNARYVPATMIGQSLCYLSIIVLPGIWLIHYVPMIFEFPMQGVLWQELLFLVPFLIAVLGMGFVIQALVTEREAIFLVWVVTTLFFLFLCGMIWPRYALPPFWKAVSDAIPVSWAIEGFIRMNSNGAQLWQVSHEYIMLWINAAGWGIAGYVMQRWVMLPSVIKLIKKGKSQQQVSIAEKN
ncbi:MAG: ABC transporter permease [Muribaculaceae bacterium]|nr:ABC transporter permease [Muribaculaceae bacterium]